MDNIRAYRVEGEDYYESEVYLVECIDEETYDEVSLTDEVSIKIDKRFSKNNLHKFPVRGRIIKSSPNAQFKEGEEIITKFWAFRKSEDGSDKEHTIIKGKKYYILKPLDIICSINKKGELRPRHGIIICKPVVGDLIHSSLHLSTNMQGRRRDIVEVINPCQTTRVKVGDFLLTQFGGDYEFYVGKDLFLSVDERFDDYFAIVDSTDWYDSSEVRREMDYTKQINF